MNYAQRLQAKRCIALLIVMLFTLMNSVYPTAVYALGQDAYEPNDIPSQATPLLLDKYYSGISIDEPNDIDWYLVNIPGKGGLREEFVDVPANLELGMEVHRLNDDGTTTVVANINNVGTDNIQLIEVDTGDYLIKLSSTTGTSSSDTFSIKVSWISPDIYEPNDTVTQAAYLQVGTWTDLSFHSTADRDWFKFTTDKAGSLSASFDNQPADLQPPTWRLYSGKDLSNPLDRSKVILPGEYYIEIFNQYGPKYFYTNPSIKVSLNPIDDFEPNDKFDLAPPIQFNQAINLNLHSYEDVDWFKIVLPQKSGLQFLFGGLEGSVNYYLFSENNVLNPIHTGYSWNGRITNELDAGVYYVKVFGAFQPDNFSLLIRATEPDAYEQFDNVTDAVYLLPGTTISRSLHVERDVDWIKVDVPKESFMVLNNASDSYFDYKLYSVKDLGAALAEGRAHGNNDFGLVPVAAGTYILRITNEDHLYNVINYNLQLKLVAGDSQENNDKPSVASTVYLDKPITIGFHWGGDVDWLKIIVPEKGGLRFNTFGNVTGDPWVSIFKPDDAFKDSESLRLFGTSYSLRYDSLTNEIFPGEYYLKIRDWSTSEPFLFSVSQVAPDKFEDNDSQDTATFLPFDSTLSMNFNSRDDSDWFKISVPKQGSVSFHYNALNGGYYPNSNLYKESDSINLVASDVMNSEPVDLPPGNYYLHLYGEFGRYTTYDLTSQFTPGDNQEPNNSPATATAVDVNSKLDLSIHSRQDVDWFKVKVYQQGGLRIAINNVPFSNTTFSLYDSNNLFKPLIERKLYGNLMITPEVEPGEYYLKIKGPEWGYSAEPFTLNLGFNIPDKNEINNSSSVATIVYQGFSATENNFHYDSDEDWFKFELPSLSNVQLTISQLYDKFVEVFSAEDLNVPILSYNINTYMYNRYLQGDTIDVNLDSGEYYVKVRQKPWKQTSETYMVDVANRRVLSDNYENNDTPDLAKAVTVGQAVYGVNLPVLGDVDWFMFDVKEAGGLKVDSYAVPYGLTLLNSLYREGDLESPITVFGYNSDSIKVNPGRYYLKMTAYRDDYWWASKGYDENSFAWIASLIPNDEHELNDSYLSATPMSFGASVNNITINAVDDEDWFKINVQEDGGFKLNFSELPLNLAAELYSSSDLVKPVWQSHYIWSNSWVSKEVSKGVYYLRLKSGSMEASDKPFSVKASFIPFDNNEINDSFTEAKSVSMGYDIPLTFHSSDDEDWFKVDLPKSGGLKVDINGLKTVVGLKVFKAGNPFEPIYAGFAKDGYSQSWNVEAGSYLVKLETRGEIIENPFNLRISMILPDINENNNSFDNAVIVPADQSIQGNNIHAQDDEDWFKFNLSFDKYIRIAFSNLMGNLVEIFSASDLTQPLIRQTIYDGIVDTNLEAGDYYLRVKGNSGGFSEDPYTFYIESTLPGPGSKLTVTGLTSPYKAGDKEKILIKSYDIYGKISPLTTEIRVVSNSPTTKFSLNGVDWSLNNFIDVNLNQGQVEVYFMDTSASDNLSINTVDNALTLIQGEVSLTLQPGSLAKVKVVPELPIVEMGSTLYFSAEGFDQFNNQVAVQPTWSIVQGTGLGVINSYTGLFKPTKEGNVTIKASVTTSLGLVTGHTDVRIDPQVSSNLPRITDISSTRPTVLSAAAPSLVNWTVTVYNPSNTPVRVFTLNNRSSFSEIWGPSDSYQPSGLYTVNYLAKDTSGHTVIDKSETISVYNYPIKIKSVKVLDGTGGTTNAVKRGQSYQVEAVMENLGPNIENPMLIVQVKDSNNMVVNIGTVKLNNFGMDNNITLTSGSTLPSIAIPGVYTVDVMVWSGWQSPQILSDIYTNKYAFTVN